jgi:hypothetical protein
MTSPALSRVDDRLGSILRVLRADPLGGKTKAILIRPNEAHSA